MCLSLCFSSILLPPPRVLSYEQHVLRNRPSLFLLQPGFIANPLFRNVSYPCSFFSFFFNSFVTRIQRFSLAIFDEDSERRFKPVSLERFDFHDCHGIRLFYFWIREDQGSLVSSSDILEQSLEFREFQIFLGDETNGLYEFR